MPIIALDGTDGSGKSTAARLLYDYLSIDRKLPTEMYAMPGGTELGMELRRVVKSKQFPTAPIAARLIFMADTAQLVVEKIRPAVEAGRFVIMDRWNPVTDLIYGAADDLDLDFIDNLQRAAKTNAVCDIYIPFRIPFEIAMHRKTAFRGAQKIGEECRIENKGNTFLSRVAKFYNELGSVEGDGHTAGRALHALAIQRTAYMRWVDATQGPKEILDQIKAHLVDSKILPPL